MEKATKHKVECKSHSELASKKGLFTTFSYYAIYGTIFMKVSQKMIYWQFNDRTAKGMNIEIEQKWKMKKEREREVL